MKIVVTDGEYRVHKNVKVQDFFEPGVYVLRIGAFGSLYLEKMDDLEIPKKLYDVDKEFRAMVLKSYHANEGNTGVLLEGYKGSGKSVTAKMISMESKLPVFLITDKIAKEIDLIPFFMDIEQPFVVFVDEFEKIFEKGGWREEEEKSHTQNSFLSLMDGALSNKHKKLFIFTTNDEVDDKFLNRPSRVRFRKKYHFMSPEQYKMIIDDMLVNKAFEEDLISNLSLQEATFDLLVSIIKEVNVQDRPYSEFKDVYNHAPKRIKYKLFVKRGTAKWKELGKIFLPSEPIRGTTYIDGCHVKEVEFINEEEMVFSSDYAHNLLPKAEQERDRNNPWYYRVIKEPEFMMSNAHVL